MFGHPALRKAKSTLRKAGRFAKRPPLWIQRSMVEQLVAFCNAREHLSIYGMLFLVSYVFLLRLPSEALPIAREAGPCSISVSGDCVVLDLRKRKNRPGGSRLTRKCWCSVSRATCPVHVVGEYCSRVAPGAPLFKGIAASAALRVLRSCVLFFTCLAGMLCFVCRQALGAIGVPDAQEYRTHDFRRGHAKDLQLAGRLGRVLAQLHGKGVVQERRCGRFWRLVNGSHLPFFFISTCTSWSLTWWCKPMSRNLRVTVSSAS